MPQCERCVTVSKKFGSKCTEIQLSIVKAESKTLSFSQLRMRFSSLDLANQIMKPWIMAHDCKTSNVIPKRIYSNLPPKWSKILREILEKEAKPSVFGEYQNDEPSNTESVSLKAPVIFENGSEPKKQSNYKSVHDKNLPSWLLDSITHEVMRQASVYTTFIASVGISIPYNL